MTTWQSLWTSPREGAGPDRRGVVGVLVRPSARRSDVQRRNGPEQAIRVIRHDPGADTPYRPRDEAHDNARVVAEVIREMDFSATEPVDAA